MNQNAIRNSKISVFWPRFSSSQEARLAEAKAAKAAKEAKEAKEKRAREAAEQLRRDKATDATSSKRSQGSSSDEEKRKRCRFFLNGLKPQVWFWWKIMDTAAVWVQFDLLRRKYTFVCYEGDEAVPRNSALLDLKSGWIRESAASADTGVCHGLTWRSKFVQ